MGKFLNNEVAQILLEDILDAEPTAELNLAS